MKIKFENTTDKDWKLCIEPFAEYIDWGIGKLVEIELKPITDQYDDDLSLAFSENILVVYECRQYEMKIFIDRELKYYTPPDRYL
jgi:hypothetical protein